MSLGRIDDRGRKGDASPRRQWIWESCLPYNSRRFGAGAREIEFPICDAESHLQSEHVIVKSRLHLYKYYMIV